ncbi:ABC-type transport auxiliary lipoprotein family protein [Piscinibacter sp. XHJ-5]|uniref:ABC-type transport auxiliary lipoprotein family protein n=1 Tax=Piscinibacter sp. XHJ-5 TaxID=3037797 RepID=UPI002452BEBA|nr:ABC-type transport auxiliary lipoprotein family protein [Piscinibacter sp. XHJ-5]
MKLFHRVLPALVLAAAATACSTGVRAPQHYHVLDPAPAPAPVAAAAQASTLLVTPTTAAGFYDAQAIVYSPTVGTRAYYQLNSWTEPPSRRLGALLTERLRRSGAFGTVADATGGVHGMLVLDTHLDEIYHDAAARPGLAKVSLTAVLSDPARRFVAGQRRFTASAPALTSDAAGAVQAFDVALGPLLDEVVAWAGQTAARSRGPDASP